MNKAGKRFRTDVEAIVVKAGLPKLIGEVYMEIDCYPPDRRERDLDNLLKGLWDSLKHARVIQNDNLIRDFRMGFKDVQRGGRVHVIIVPREDLLF